MHPAVLGLCMYSVCVAWINMYRLCYVIHDRRHRLQHIVHYDCWSVATKWFNMCAVTEQGMAHAHVLAGHAYNTDAAAIQTHHQLSLFHKKKEMIFPKKKTLPQFQSNNNTIMRKMKSI